MESLKTQFLKLLMIGMFAVVPYAETNAATGDDIIAIRVREGAKVKASPVRASVRRDARRDRMDDNQESSEDYSESTSEDYSESTSEEYSEPEQQQSHDRGRPGGIR